MSRDYNSMYTSNGNVPKKETKRVGTFVKIGIGGAIIAFFVLAFLLLGWYQIDETEYAVLKTFGQVEVIEEPGFKFKIPFIQTVDTLPKEILLYDLAPSDVITKDKKTKRHRRSSDAC